MQFMMNHFRGYMKSFLMKLWIWVIAIMLCVVSLGGKQVVVCRIVYMSFFLIFVLSFQISYTTWRKMMYWFLLVVVIYSILYIILISTYQFDGFPLYWQSYAGIPIKMQHYIGLEVFDIGDLLIHLLRITSLVVIVLIQLIYFHKDFLDMSDIRHRNSKVEAPQINVVAPENDNHSEEEIKIEAADVNMDPLKRVDWRKMLNLYLKNLIKLTYATVSKMFNNFSTEIIEVLWKVFELHMRKIVLSSFVLLAVCDVCVLHLAFIILSVVALTCGKNIQYIIIHLCSALTSFLLLSKMIYQMEYIRHEQWEADCPGLPSLNSKNKFVGNVKYTMNNADWIGFQKTSYLPEFIKGYIGIIFVCILHVVVCIRQKYMHCTVGLDNTLSSIPNPSFESTTYWAYQEREILFCGVNREVADDGILSCVKFLFNYGFYKFGVEICLITTVVVIGIHMDAYSIVYSVWLCYLVYLGNHRGRSPMNVGGTRWGGGRDALATVWIYFVFTIAILLFLQYILAVGLPPGLCIDFPWYLNERLRRLQDWMPLPDYVNSPKAIHLVCDFILLLLVYQQHVVFRMENVPSSNSHPGGSNRETFLDVDVVGRYPVPDFISNVTSWLDVVKRVIFLSFFWFSLAVVFLAGTNQVNIFALGYLTASFIFLWKGNYFYLRPITIILDRWNMLLGYNVTVILCKCLIQMLGCVFIQDLLISACWVIPLLGIACTKRLKYEISDSKGCSVSQDGASLAWDGVCFAFLLLQRRIFGSCYFLHVVNETKVQAFLASRGAELIEELSKRQITEQKDLENQELEKIKYKMERIKASYQLRRQASLYERENHYEAIHSGDYFMFEVDDDMKEEEINVGKSEGSMFVKENEQENNTDDPSSKSCKRRLTVTQLFSSAMKTDVKQAAEMASMSNQYYIGVDENDRRNENMEETENEPVASLELTSDTIPTSGHSSHPDTRSHSSGNLPRVEHVLQKPSSSVSVRSSFQSSHIPPLSEEEEPQVGGTSTATTPTHGRGPSAIATQDGPPGRGGDKRGPGDHNGSDPDDGPPEGDVPGSPDSERAMGIRPYVKFVWALIQSLMVSATLWLNQFSRDYRYIAYCLARERTLLKEKSDFQEWMRAGSAMTWEPAEFASWKTLSDAERERKGSSGKSSVAETKMKDTSKEKMIEDMDNSINDVWENNENITVESPALVSLEAIEAEDGRRGLGPQKEASSFGGGRSPAACLFIALWYAVISHSELVCYLAVYLHQINSASLLSTPLPLMVFLWGTLSVPRPSMTFWMTIITYTEVIVLIKCIFHFNYLPWNQEAIPENFPFFPPRIIGIEINRRHAIFDLTLLLAFFFHRFMLKSLGLWESKNLYNTYMRGDRGSDIIQTRNDTDSISEAENTSGMETQGSTTQDITRLKVDLKKFLQVYPFVLSNYFSSIKAFLHQLLDSTTKVTADVYAYMFMCDLLNFIVIIFGFPAFGTQYQDGGVLTYIEENRIPVPFLTMLIFQSALMIIDRALYLQKSTVGKLTLQIFLVFTIHIWMFIVLPSVTNREFSASLPTQMWYAVKCIYLLLSAYQIRSAYPSHSIRNFLSKQYNYLNQFLLIGFMNIPFLFELRTLMDWIWTDTSMTLSEWLILEDIFTNAFQIKCTRTEEKHYPLKRGERKSSFSKYLIGGGILLGILAVVWFPLVFFSLEHTVGEVNLPYDVTLELRLGAYQPMFRMTTQKHSLLRFSESSWNAFGSIYQKDQAALSFLSKYDWQDVSVAKLSGYSTNSWTISPPAKNQMIEEILSDKPVLVTLTWTVLRETSYQDIPVICTDSQNITMEAVVNTLGGNIARIRNPMRDILAAMLNGIETVTPVILPSLLPKFLKVTKEGKASSVNQLMKISSSDEYEEWGGIKVGGDGSAERQEFRNLSLKFQHGSVFEWWEVGEVCSDPIYSALLSHLPFQDVVDPNTGNCPYLTIFIFNDKAFPIGLKFISRSGIIGLYITFVLLASKIMHRFFTGMSVTIMFYELPNVDKILQLCSDIYLVRENGEWYLEEDLFAKLLFLYRSPEMLIKWTQPISEAIEPPPGNTLHSPDAESVSPHSSTDAVP